MNYPYKIKNLTLPSFFNSSVLLHKDKPLFAYAGEKPFSYSEFKNKVDSTVKLLQDSGIKKDDKVILLSENMPHWAVAYFSVTYFGGVIVPILTDFHTDDVHRIIEHSEAKAVFVSKKFQKTIEKSTTKNLKVAINLDSLELIDSLSNTEYIATQPKEYEQTTPKEDDLAGIIYTSGTTGNSKGVMLSHKNLVTNALSTFEKIKIESKDIFLSILPLAHTFECTTGMLVPILNGASVYYIKKPPTPSVLLKVFASVKPTIILSVPLIIEKIYKTKVLPTFTNSFYMKFLYKIPFIRKELNKIAGAKLIKSFGGRLKIFGLGGAPLSPYVEKFLNEANFPYMVGYGLTETAPLLTAGIFTEKQKIKSAGTPFYGVEIKIKNPNKKTGEGEILARSPSIMMGYYKNDEQTAEVMEDDWFLTGDLGYLDDEGYLFISGRSKNVIIGSSGENIYPEQIESLINRDAIIADSLVMLSDSKLIARIHLDYEKLDKNIKKDKIKNLLESKRVEINSQLSSFSRMNSFIEQEEEFIKTPTKKIKRFLYTKN